LRKAWFISLFTVGKNPLDSCRFVAGKREADTFRTKSGVGGRYSLEGRLFKLDVSGNTTMSSDDDDMVDADFYIEYEDTDKDISIVSKGASETEICVWNVIVLRIN
jgi:hypothetical protein